MLQCCVGHLHPWEEVALQKKRSAPAYPSKDRGRPYTCSITCLGEMFARSGTLHVGFGRRTYTDFTGSGCGGGESRPRFARHLG